MITRTLSVREAAGFLHVQPKTIRAWIKLGRLAASKIGKQYFILEPEIERLIAVNRASTPVSRLDAMTKDQRRADLLECLNITPSQIMADRRMRNTNRRAQIDGNTQCR